MQYECYSPSEMLRWKRTRFQTKLTSLSGSATVSALYGRGHWLCMNSISHLVHCSPAVLPLAISIAGQLVKDLQLTEHGSDWREIVSIMKEEMSQQQTVAERLVDVSLKGIRGPQQKSVIALFKSLALLPEDTHCPPDILVLMHEVGVGVSASSDEQQTGLSRNHRTMQVRRWMKMLIDRSLVLVSAPL